MTAPSQRMVALVAQLEKTFFKRWTAPGLYRSALDARAALLDAIAELEKDARRLQELLDMRPPYYCPRCRCGRCGNTLASESKEQ